jgi:6,7-dimethyl-8-ribityllumazine synthase
MPKDTEFNASKQLEVSVSSPASRQIAIVVSQYNNNITEKLCKAAVSTLRENGWKEEEIEVIRVPGAWELTYGTQLCVSRRDICGVIALGAVIKGETTHDQHINRAVTMGLMQLSIDYNKPIALGLLTVNTLEQAIQRSGGTAGNKGEECANALIDCLALAQKFE